MYNELYMKETSSLENNDDLDRKKVNNFAAHLKKAKFCSSCFGCVTVSYHLCNNIQESKHQPLAILSLSLFKNSDSTDDNLLFASFYRLHSVILYY